MMRGPLRLVPRVGDRAREYAEQFAQFRWHMQRACELAHRLGLEIVPFVNEARTAYVATKRRK